MAECYTRDTQGGNPPAQNLAGAPTAQGATAQAGNPAPANAPPVNALASSVLDNVIPVIKERKGTDTVTNFKYKQLDKLMENQRTPSSWSYGIRWHATRRP